MGEIWRRERASARRWATVHTSLWSSVHLCLSTGNSLNPCLAWVTSALAFMCRGKSLFQNCGASYGTRADEVSAEMARLARPSFSPGILLTSRDLFPVKHCGASKYGVRTEAVGPRTRPGCAGQGQPMPAQKKLVAFEPHRSTTSTTAAATSTTMQQTTTFICWNLASVPSVSRPTPKWAPVWEKTTGGSELLGFSLITNPLIYWENPAFLPSHTSTCLKVISRNCQLN